MESQYKGSSNGGVESGVAVANRRKMRGWDFVLRFLALALSLAAAVVLGVDKETKMVPLQLVPTLPPVNVPAPAKWHYLSAFVHNNIIYYNEFKVLCGGKCFSLCPCSHLFAPNFGTWEWKEGYHLMVILFDLVMVALLFSGVGAALAIGLMGYHGNSHVRWNKVCNVFDKFCDQAAAAIGLSAAAAFAFFLLVVLATFNLHKKN